MADTTAAAPATASPKKAAKAKKPRTKPAHPKTSEMVRTAIKELKERGGSSLQAIKKYIASHYKVDVEKLSPFIKKYLKSSVAKGELVQTKGKGASGSFKLSASSLKDKPAKKKAPVKKSSEKKPKKAVAAKKPKKTAAKKTKSPKKAKAPSKTKKAKSPKKPKAPKPKKAAAKPKAKKAAPKKK